MKSQAIVVVGLFLNLDSFMGGQVRDAKVTVGKASIVSMRLLVAKPF